MSLFNKKTKDVGNKFEEQAEKLQKSLKDDSYYIPKTGVTYDKKEAIEGLKMYGISGYNGWSGYQSSRIEPEMIFCSYCDSANYRTQTRCSFCGAPFTRKEYAESNPLKAIQDMVDEGYQLLDFLQKRREKYISDEKLRESIMGNGKC